MLGCRRPPREFPLLYPAPNTIMWNDNGIRERQLRAQTARDKEMLLRFGVKRSPYLKYSPKARIGERFTKPTRYFSTIAMREIEGTTTAERTKNVLSFPSVRVRLNSQSSIFCVVCALLPSADQTPIVGEMLSL